MLRSIALVRTSEDADIAALVSGAEAMCAADPNVLAAQISTGLKLLEAPPHADYSLILDFEDEAGWRRYLDGEPHRKFDTMAPTPGTFSRLIPVTSIVR